MHLLNWERLTSLKSVGGWGIKNIYNFGKPLVAKSHWRVLFTKSMWNEVIIAKYIKNNSILDWLRRDNRNSKGISNCWANLVNALIVLCDWLVWIPGDDNH